MNSNFWMIDPGHTAELHEILAYVMTAEELAVPLAAAAPLKIVNGVAKVPITGPLMARRSQLLDLFGMQHTSYADITAQVRQAEADPEVTSIQFQVNSPGGQAGNPIMEAADTIFAATKPTVAVVYDMAASAAYWLASQANEIALIGPASMVGSIGAAREIRVDPTTVSIASTNAPLKRPDISTDEGKAAIRGPLDAIHSMFVAAVARGRNTTPDTVNRDFGQGGVVLADAALATGMADRVIRAGIVDAHRDIVAGMDFDTLKLSHPDVYAQCEAAGVAKERSRANAHLKLAKKAGEIDAAIGYIAAGTAVTDDDVFITYTAGAIDRMHQGHRAADDVPDITPVAPTPGADADDAAILATFADAGHQA